MNDEEADAIRCLRATVHVSQRHEASDARTCDHLACDLATRTLGDRPQNDDPR